MTTDNKSSSGADDQNASGDDGKQKDIVSYETHRRLLGEKKELQEKFKSMEAKLAEIEAEKVKQKEEELKQQGNFKKLLEEREKELEAERNKYNGLMSHLTDSAKRNKVLKFISGKVPLEAADKLLDVSGVAVDENGNVDENTAKVVAQEFEKKFPYLVLKDNVNGGLPNHAAGGAAGKKLTYEEWTRLPSSKEMSKRWNDVDWSTAKKQ